jgi:hypothetical protein
MTEGEVRNGAGMRVGSGNVFSKVPVEDSKEMQGSTAAAAGGAPAKAINATEMFSPKDRFQFTLLRVKAKIKGAECIVFEDAETLPSKARCERKVRFSCPHFFGVTSVMDEDIRVSTNV